MKWPAGRSGYARAGLKQTRDRGKMRANAIVLAILALKGTYALVTPRTRIVPRSLLALQLSPNRKVVSLNGVADRPDIQRAMVRLGEMRTIWPLTFQQSII